MNDVESAHASDQEAFGDSGPWVRHLPLAWWLAASPAGNAIAPPADPTTSFLRAKQTNADTYGAAHAQLIGYWSPLMHLCHFGLGWSRPDLGLSRWLETGSPTEDPVLSVVQRWWPADRLADFLSWAAMTLYFLEAAQGIAQVAGLQEADLTPLPDRYESQRTQAWSDVWGGGSDPLHLGDHTLVAIDTAGLAASRGEIRRTDNTDSSGSGLWHRALVLPTYAGWYRTLLTQDPTTVNGRSVRTDVVCPPVGWLGQYRQSRKTGLQFRGRHQWHVLGN